MSSFELINETPNNPLVSVAMLAYNHEKYIEQAIESVLMQEFDHPYQIVIAEDFSTDKTREIVLSYQKRYPKLFKLILQHKNVGSTQNNYDLLNSLDGQYVAALEADDYWINAKKLSIQLELINSTGASLVLSSNVGPFDKKIIRYNNKQISYLTHKGHTSSWFFKNHVFNQNEWNDFKKCYAGDICLLLFLSKRADLVYYRDRFSFYRHHGGGIFSSLKKREQAFINIKQTLILRKHMPLVSFLRRLGWQTKAYLKSFTYMKNG